MNSIYHQATLHSATITQAEAVGEKDEHSVQRPNGLNATIIEHITEAYVALDHQWHIISFNRQTTQLMQDQDSQVDLFGKNLWECFPTLVGTAFYQRCLEAATTGKTAQFEVKSRHLQKWFRIHIFPSAEYITIFLSDITAQKQAEEQLRFQANILQHIRDSVIVTDLQGNITYWNEGADRIFGFAQEEMIGQNVALLFPNIEVPLLTHGLQQIAAGQDYASQWQKRRQDGTEIWIEVKVTLLHDEQGEACGLLGVAKDISQRKLAEDQVRRSKDQLEAILKNVGDGILVQDATGKIIYVNQAVASRLGFASIDDVLASEPYAFLEWFDVTDEDGQPFDPAHFPGRRAVMGEDNPQVTIRYAHKYTHEVQWNLIRSTLVRERDHTPLFVISVMQDITQLKELEQRKDEFIMHISHELRTPLTALSGFLQIINDFRSQLDESTMTTFLSRSLQNCEELTLLVNEVLEVLQFRHDTRPAPAEALALRFIVREVIAQLGPQKEQEYSLQLNIPEGVTVWANRQHLYQVLRNLLSNVFKYAPQQTPVTISAIIQEGFADGTTSVPSVTISIQDAGPGIPLVEQQQLFEKFSRLKRDLASPIRGTGLGLYICKQLVERMGGRIWVESSGRPGDGSCFCFTCLGIYPCPRNKLQLS